MKVDANLMGARCLLLARKPWYGHAAATIDWVADDSMPTMAVTVRPDGRTLCYYSPSFVRHCTPGELAAVIEHEIEHVLRQHCGRGSGRDSKLFNVACDMVINGHQDRPQIGIVNAKTGKPEIPLAENIFWLPPSWSNALTAEQCYDKLVADGKQPSQFDDRYFIGQHDLWEAIDKELVQQAVNQISQAVAAAGMEVPDSVKPFLPPPNSRNLPWESMLARFVKHASGTSKRTDHSRRSRRMDVFGMPGRKPSHFCHLVVVVDTSGSVTDAVLSSFFGELETLLPLAAMDVLTWSDRIGTFLSPYTANDWRKLRRVRHGGTDMIAPVHWLRDRNRLADGLLMLTDGDCHWPSRQSVPLLVVCSSPRGKIVEPGWGEVVYLSDS